MEENHDERALWYHLFGNYDLIITILNLTSRNPPLFLEYFFIYEITVCVDLDHAALCLHYVLFKCSALIAQASEHINPSSINSLKEKKMLQDHNSKTLLGQAWCNRAGLAVGYHCYNLDTSFMINSDVSPTQLWFKMSFTFPM